MKDFFGKDLALDDQVACIRIGYRAFTMGKVAGFTNQKVRVVFKEDGMTDLQATLRYPNEIIRK